MRLHNIKEIFDTISKKENKTFKLNELYYQKTKFKVETQQGYKSVIGMIIKEDIIYNIKTTNYSINVSKNHRIKLESECFKLVKTLEVGDILSNSKSKEVITQININTTEIVYDLSIDDNVHEYLDVNGFTHHNTFGVKKVLNDTLGAYGEGPRGKWAFYEGLSTTGFGLFKILLLNKNKLIVFDDSDSIWNDRDMINMMKIVTSDSGDRTISWSSNSTANVSLMNKSQREEYELEYMQAIIENPNTKMKPPSTFNFNGQMINISNLKASIFDNAIKSRAIFIDVYLAQRDVLRRMATIKELQGEDKEKTKMLLEMLDPYAIEALEGKGKYAGEVKYITPDIARKNKSLNMRSLDIASALYDANVKNLKHMVSLYA